MNKKVLFTFIGSLCISSFIAGCGEKAAEPPGNQGGTPAPGGGAAVNAEAVYKQSCASCHGANLEGVLPGKTNLQKVGANRTRDQIVSQIQNGGNGMPGFKSTLSGEQINALADWLAAKK